MVLNKQTETQANTTNRQDAHLIPIMITEIFSNKVDRWRVIVIGCFCTSRCLVTGSAYYRNITSIQVHFIYLYINTINLKTKSANEFLQLHASSKSASFLKVYCYAGFAYSDHLHNLDINKDRPCLQLAYHTVWLGCVVCYQHSLIVTVSLMVLLRRESTLLMAGWFSQNCIACQQLLR